MQSILNLHGTCGLPLCLSGITHPLSLSKEMADHDRRREAMKKERSDQARRFHANHEMGFERNHERVVEEIREVLEVDGDLDVLVHDLMIYMCLACTAKAA